MNDGWCGLSGVVLSSKSVSVSAKSLLSLGIEIAKEYQKTKLSLKIVLFNCQLQ